MENPLLSDAPGSNPEETPQEEPQAENPEAAQEEAPMEASEEAPKEKKPFFTTGKIVAIFAALVIIGTVVGALIYSQSAERFKGQTARLEVTPITSIQTLQTAAEITCPDGFNKVSQTNPTTGEQLELCMCPGSQFPELTGSLTSETLVANFNPLMQFECKPFVCDLTEAELNKIVSDYEQFLQIQGVDLTLTQNFKDNFIQAYNTWNTTNPECVPPVCPGGEFYMEVVGTDNCFEICELPKNSFTAEAITASINHVQTDAKAVADLQDALQAAQAGTSYEVWYDATCKEETTTTTTTTEQQCPSPDMNLVMSDTRVTAVTYDCFCPDGEYYVVGSNTCEPIDCDLTQEELKAMVSRPDDFYLTDVTINRLNNYDSWYQEVCTEITCDDLLGALGNAYYSQNWDTYRDVLKQIQEEGCLEGCNMNLYWAIYYMATNQADQAREQINIYLDKCIDECELSFGILSYAIEYLSEKELAGDLTEAETTILRDLVTKYIENCQCLEIEALLDNPGFDDDDYFTLGEPLTRTGSISTLDAASSIESVSSAATLTSVSSGLRTTSVEKAEDTTSSSDAVLDLEKRDSVSLLTAHAQSISPTVLTVLQDVYTDLCVPEDEPEECVSLSIVKPSDQASMSIDREFSASSDELMYEVIGKENVQDYRLKSDTITFDGQSNDISTDKISVSIEGGPAEGQTDVITVVAYDVAGNRLEQCSDELKVTRQVPPPPGKECRSLTIVAPTEAVNGSPTVEITADGYSNKVLEISVDGDAGSVYDFRYSSVNGYITFNGDQVLDTTDTTVIMEGVVPEGQSDTITVWARHPETLGGLQECHDSYTVTVPLPPKDIPPPPPEEPPPTIITQEPPEPPSDIVVIPPTTPEPEPVLHAAAPVQPDTGPGVLIYLVGAGLGGYLYNRKRKK